MAFPGWVLSCAAPGKAMGLRSISPVARRRRTAVPLCADDRARTIRTCRPRLTGRQCAEGHTGGLSGHCRGSFRICIRATMCRPRMPPVYSCFHVERPSLGERSFRRGTYVNGLSGKAVQMKLSNSIWCFG